MNKLTEIAKAWIISFNPTDEQKMISEHRLHMCNLCPFKEYQDKLDFYYCSKCGCPLKSKIFSPVGPQACPDSRWEL